jgi:hypothetical protein
VLCKRRGNPLLRRGAFSDYRPAALRRGYVGVPVRLRCRIFSAVVEGTWEGKISSVHCDLFEGGKQGRRVTDWWDRGVPSKTSLSRRTFAQEFVEAKGRKIEDPLDPAVRYSTSCQAEAEGGAAFDDAWVEGRPPG